MRIWILLKIQLEFLYYYDKFKIYKKLITHLAIIEKEISMCKSILYKGFKEFIKKFGNDKNKDKNHNFTN